MIQQVVRELVVATRLLARNWRISAIVLLTIAVTVGASTAVLSVVSPALLKSLPFTDPERLYTIEPRSAQGQSTWVSYATLADWQDRLRPHARVAGYSIYDFSVFGDEGPEPLLAARVTPGLFDMLGTRTSVGRAFEDDDHRVGGQRSVMLTHGFWQRRYGADPAIIGRVIELAGPTFLSDVSGEYRVIGVLSPEFWLFSNDLAIVVPTQVSARQLASRKRSDIETVLAKFEPGIGNDAADARVSEVVRGLAAQYGAAEPTARASTLNAQAAHFQEFRAGLLLTLVSAILMFVLATVNVAAMLIALAVARRKELTIRASLGASRFTLFRQALIEGLLLGATGGTLGVLLGTAGTSVLRSVVPASLVNRLPGEESAIVIDVQSLLIIGGAVLIVSLLCGVVMALASGGARLESVLREASRAATEAPKYGTLRTAILAPQLALAVALVLTTGVLATSLLHLQSVDVGLNTTRLVSFWLNLDPRRYESAAQRTDLYERVIERTRALPDVQAVSGIDLPIQHDWQKTPVTRAEDGNASAIQVRDVFTRSITPGYFQMLGIEIVAGRSFEASDTSGTLPVAIVSRTLAQRLWPNRDPVGQQVRAGDADPSRPWLTVVGVAADGRRAPHEPPAATLYRPLRQQTPDWLYLLIRTRTESADVAASVRQAVWAEDHRQPVEGPYVVANWIREMTGLLRFVVLVGLIFAGLGVVLAFSGVYALIADLSQRSMREIGIRKALGATTQAILRLYLLRSVRAALPALLVGGMLGALLVRGLASELEGVAAPQVWVVLVVLTLFAALVVTATYLGSRRAAETSPAVTMRVE
jgi:predicted permease